MKYAQPNGRMGWAPRMRSAFGYYGPDDRYEHLLMNLVTEDTRWLDIGAGDSPCSSDRIARLLSERCRVMVGLDPSENLARNPYVHQKHFCYPADFHPAEPFNLLTMRMVVEHVQDPEAFVASVVRLADRGATIVVYTVHRWSPGAIAAHASPMCFHHAVKKWLWRTEKRDTFQVHYRMNTRKRLRTLFQKHGVVEKDFWLVDDCRTLGRFRAGLRFELTMRAGLNRVGLAYPERCLIGVYRR